MIMMKNISIAAFFFVALSLLPSCRKCYVCHNTCTVCTLLDSSGHTVGQQKICSDSSTYGAQKATLTANGYNCVASSYTYTDDFCVNNKNAEGQYLIYHEGNGAYTCTPN